MTAAATTTGRGYRAALERRALRKPRVAHRRRIALDLNHAIIVSGRRRARPLEAERRPRFGEARIIERGEQRLAHRRDRRRREAAACDERQVPRGGALGDDRDALDE